MIRSPRRAGSSLTEVLVAIFVMAAGMLALLTLFPLGAMQIQQAVKDDRTAQTAVQADTLLRTYWRANVVQSNTDQALPTAMNNPTGPIPWNPPLTPATPPAPSAGTMPALTAANSGEPSYPVVIDPLGFLARSTNERFWVAHQSFPGLPTLLPRRNLGMMKATFQQFNSAEASANCSMMDDLTYDTNGEVHYDRPNPPNAPALNVRQGRYNWAAIIQRPRNIDATTAKLTILVFDNRPPFLAFVGDEVVRPPNTWGIGTRDLSITVPIRTPDQPPLIRRGGWIMDGTIYKETPPLTGYVRNANFYRIVGVTETATSPTPVPPWAPNGTVTYTLDLETPIKTDSGNLPAASPLPPANHQIYLFASLSEVFERDNLAPDNPIQP